MELLHVLSATGARIVGDDTAACGRRVLGPGRSEEPIRRMAERLAGAPACSTRGGSIDDRIERMRGLAQKSGAQGVVFLGVKFCEPELFYWPGIKEGLEAAGLRTLMLELDPTTSLPLQAITRLEAFVESLS
jgi:benzoyl-CoA reductase/2-hydroxyglutaryl-CoA dehydratase subunit BcrC/BadD/HgdB